MIDFGEFTTCYASLQKDCSYHSWHLGVVKALLVNENYARVMNGSQFSYPIALGIGEIKNALVHFAWRCWDQNANAASIHFLSRNLPKKDVVISQHEKRRIEEGRPYDPQHLIQTREKLIAAIRAGKKDPVFKRLRELRNKKLAHMELGARLAMPPTLNDLIAVCELTMTIVDLSGYLVERTGGEFVDFAKHSEKQTKALFEALPQLKTLE